ncbi:hypothetical protein B7Z28_02170 [Candidatus Saccharibacteria bacterium 32-45-3]|nr:MAG: hypothetical protein B7Z28_02170 [Candidatus Saccharibacteria bacterium 32-45-3]
MANKIGRQKMYVGLAVIITLLGAVITFAIFSSSSSGEPDPYKQQPAASDTDTNDDSNTDSDSDTANPIDDENLNNDNSNTKDDVTNDGDNSPTPVTIPPEQLATIDIEPMGLTVSYVKGIGGFGYQILRSPDGTRSVEFRNESLIGTKCTDDEGTFASIIENPTSDAAVLLDQKATIDGVTYGLSLSSGTCTGEPDMLANYQKSFSDAFGLLKKTN